MTTATDQILTLHIVDTGGTTRTGTGKIRLTAIIALVELKGETDKHRWNESA